MLVKANDSVSRAEAYALIRENELRRTVYILMAWTNKLRTITI